MITIACMYHCDLEGCETSVKGRVVPQLLVANGQPAGFNFNPQLPAGWSAGAEEQRIATPGQGPQVGVVGFVCTECTKRLQAAEEPSPIVGGVMASGPLERAVVRGDLATVDAIFGSVMARQRGAIREARQLHARVAELEALLGEIHVTLSAGATDGDIAGILGAIDRLRALAGDTPQLTDDVIDRCLEDAPAVIDEGGG